MRAGDVCGVDVSRTKTSIRVGIDLVHVPDVVASIAEFGDRYLHRIYSPSELRSCAREDGSVAAERLAARFAAKEAVIKALRPTFGVDYRTIEISTDRQGGPTVALDPAGDGSGRLLGAARIVSAAVSLSHDGDYASAVFMAITDESSQHAPQHIHGGPR